MTPEQAQKIAILLQPQPVNTDDDLARCAKQLVTAFTIIALAKITKLEITADADLPKLLNNIDGMCDEMVDQFHTQSKHYIDKFSEEVVRREYANYTADKVGGMLRQKFAACLMGGRSPAKEFQHALDLLVADLSGEKSVEQAVEEHREQQQEEQPKPRFKL